MNVSIMHNIQMTASSRQLKTNAKDETKSTERLSSGYRINRAADDAAGLSISEKMRLQIRALKQGTNNAMDGVSWVQIGDAALNEVHDVLHRMNELAIASVNDTNTHADRAAMQDEFEQLQNEIDRITDNANFNTKNIFEDHEATYYQFEGNVKWDYRQAHKITDDNNDLVIKYREKADDPAKEIKIQVQNGVYTTQELIDEIDDAMLASGLKKDGIYLEYTADGYCNVNLEGGETIDAVTGGLSYLLYDMHGGGSLGALIGTTVFPTPETKLDITDQNNQMTFTVERTDGSSQKVNFSLVPNRSYSKLELMDELNKQLAAQLKDQGIDVQATEYGQSIRIASQDCIISGLKGNMFKIDEGREVYTSVFYDNIKYGTVTAKPSSLIGGAVIAPDDRIYNSNEVDPKFSRFHFDSSNDTLVFAPNGSKDPKTLKFDHDRDYTISDVRNTLNNFFRDNDLKLTAGLTNPSYDYNSRLYFLGLTITSQISGVESDVGIDEKKSSAYHTLFTDRKYTQYGVRYDPTRETADDHNAYVLGGKEFYTSSFPFKVEADKNDTFRLNVTQTDSTSGFYDIKLDAKEYASLDEIKDAINEKIGNIDVLKDKVTAITSERKLMLMAADTTIRNLSVSRTPSGTTPPVAERDTGYYQLFVGETVTYRTTYSTNTTLPNPKAVCANSVVDANNNVTIGAGEKNFSVLVDGKSYDVTLDAKTYTVDELKKTLNDQLQARDLPENIRADFTSTSGSSCIRNYSDSGNTSYTRTSSYHDDGDSKPHQGQAGKYDDNEAATVTLSSMKQLPTAIDDTNDKLVITINDQKEELTLAHTSSASDIVKNIQAAIDQKYGTDGTGAIVSLDANNKLVFTARLTFDNGADVNGAKTNITIDPTDAKSTFVEAGHRNETPAEFDMYVQNSFTIEAGKESLSFDYESGGQKETLTVTLTAGTHTAADLRKAINDQLGTKISAGGSGTNIHIKTIDTGNDQYIALSVNATKNYNSAAAAIFGGKEAKVSCNKDLQDNIKVTNANNRFYFRRNGSYYDDYVTLDTNTTGYTRAGFIDELNKKLAAYGISAVAKGDSLELVGDPYKGINSISASYNDSAGSVMPAMFGQENVHHEGVSADFNGQGQLVLTKNQPGGTVSVTSQHGSVFQTPERYISSVTRPSPYALRQSSVHGKIDGRNLDGPVTIDNWNNRLTFNLYEKNASAPATYDATQIDITLDNGTYDFDALRDHLQAKLDEKAAGKLEVFVSASGVVIQTTAVGTSAHIGDGGTYSLYRNNFSGSFYEKVICQAAERAATLKETKSPGTYGEDAAYAVGRKDVKNHPVKIQTDVNDSLHLDLTAGSKTYELDLTLDAGSYNGDTLTKMLQKKLNEALVAKNLKENTILVGVGEKLSDVEIIGSNDANALSFRLNTDNWLPEDGTYIIDGVSGTAAFSVFYSTEGDISIASVQGTVPIHDGITIQEGQTDLSFSVDDEKFTFDFEPKIYTSKELVDELNKQLQAQDAPIVAKEEDGLLKLVHTKYGNHKITDFSGGAKQALLFRENYRKRDPEKIHIQFSNLRDDNLEIDKPNVNTLSLEVNSLAVSRAKYAEKAMLHLQVALERVSAVRSYFGATQNRIEKAILGNENKMENTQASESRIRDTEMFDEILTKATNDILKQAMESIMAQASSNKENIVQLLF